VGGPSDSAAPASAPPLLAAPLAPLAAFAPEDAPLPEPPRDPDRLPEGLAVPAPVLAPLAPLRPTPSDPLAPEGDCAFEPLVSLPVEPSAPELPWMSGAPPELQPHAASEATTRAR
jgi:hypothetical protein